MKILPWGTGCIEDWFKGHALVERLGDVIMMVGVEGTLFLNFATSRGSELGTALDVTLLEMEAWESLGFVVSGVSFLGIWPGRTTLIGFGDEIGSAHFEVEGTGFE